MNIRYSALLTASLLMIAATLPGAARSAIVLDGEEDFTRIARGGFEQTIDGIFNPGPILQSNLGSGRNSYAWSMGWYDSDADGPGKPALYVGTVRDVLCPFGFDLPITEPCLTDPEALFGFDANQRAEIWRYEPSTYADYGGANGSWTRVYQSPLDGFGDDQLTQAIQLIIDTNPDAIPPDLQGFAGYLDQLALVPRDVGYRNQATCQTYGDSRERLFATTSGIPGNVLYIKDDGTGFEETSRDGLKANLARFLPPEVFPEDFDPDAFPLLEGLPYDGDIGYRGLVCFNGYLITSPASSIDSGSQDVAGNPFLLGNPDPAMQDPSVPDDWKALVDFRNFPDIDYDRDGDPTNHASDCDDCGQGSATGDLSNYGAFDIAVLGGDLWVAVSNRGNDAGGSDRGGVELWRGDGAQFGTECTTFDPSTADDGCAGISWNKVIDVGAGRREDSIGPDVDNALGVFGTLGGQLYMALWESGFGDGDGTLAELIRVTPSTPGNETWELLIGGGRKDFATDPVLNGTTATGTMTCVSGSRYDEDTADIPDPTGPDCYPLSGRHFGYGPAQVTGANQFDYVDLEDDDVEGPVHVPVNAGTSVYFWRMGTHAASGGDELYLGTLDQDSFLIPEPADGDFISQYLYQYIPPNFGFLCGGDFALLEFWEFLQAADPTLPELTDLIPFPIYPLFVSLEDLEVVTLPDCEVNPTGGLDLVKTTDGATWTEITTNGFGNPLNYGVRAILSAMLPDGTGEQVLFIGTANPFTNGPDVPGTEGFWGGLEVFIGADISQVPTLPEVVEVATDELQDRTEVSWEADEDAVAYKIFRSETNNLSDARLIATLEGEADNFVDTGARPETAYYYWVKVITADGASVYGTPEQGYTKSCTFYSIPTGGGAAVICL